MTRGLFRLGSLSSACLALAFAGCNSTHMTQPPAQLAGNWAFTSQSTSSNPTSLTLNAGLTTQVNGSITAIGHLNGASCVASASAITLTGSVDNHDRLVLKSQPFSGTTLTITGQLAPDGSSVTNTQMTFSGGSCSSLGTVAATTTQYTQINGTYSGNFTDAGGSTGAVTAQLTQTTQPDANGTFHLSGSATFASNPCFTQPLVTDSLVTGSNLSTTYTQGNATITAVGTFNSDATVLTVTNWQVAGGICDGESGTGLLTKQ